MGVDFFGIWYNSDGSVKQIVPKKPDSQSRLTAADRRRAVGAHFNAMRSEAFILEGATGTVTPIVFSGAPFVLPVGINEQDYVVGNFSRDGRTGVGFIIHASGFVRTYQPQPDYIATRILSGRDFDPANAENDIVAVGYSLRGDGTEDPTFFCEDGTQQIVPRPSDIRSARFVSGTQDGVFFGRATGVNNLQFMVGYKNGDWFSPVGQAPVTAGVNLPIDVVGGQPPG
jgi:hypothetical protein